MSQTFEGSIRPFYVHCADVGLNCNYVIFGNNEGKVMDAHAINSEEMITCMRLKIRKNIHLYRDSVIGAR
jgi:predicted small metal-binding protein